MKGYRNAERALAIYLSSITGFVDTIGFMYLGGYFLSFMSGNTTRLTAAASRQDWTVAGITASIMLTFLVGVGVGAAISQLGRRMLPRTRTREAVLLFICLTSTFASILIAVGAQLAAMYMLAFTVGAMNSTFERDGEVSIALTYMTGTLVKMSQRFVGALFGDSHKHWLGHFALWASLACGALLGGRAYVLLDTDAVYLVNALIVSGTIVAIINRQRLRNRGLPV